MASDAERSHKHLARWPLIQYLLFGLFCSSLAAPALWRLSAPGAQSDIYIHFEIAQRLWEEGTWFAYSLYYPLIMLLTLGGQVPLAQVASTLLLIGLTLVKAAVALKVAREWINNNHLAQLAALSYVFSMPIVNPFIPDDVYLGQLSANVWHNSTTILASIFVLPAFVYGLKTIEIRGRGNAVKFSAALFGLVACKPNFALVLIPSLLLLSTLKNSRSWGSSGSRSFLLVAIATIPALLLLVIEYLVIFVRGVKAFENYSIALRPLEVWANFSQNLPLSLFLSLAGLFAFAWAFGWSRIFSDDFLVLGIAVSVLAVLQFALLAEIDPSGAVAYNGNWYWAVVPAFGLLFFRASVLILADLCDALLPRPKLIACSVAALALLLHLLSGIYYVLNVGSQGFRTFVL